MLSLLFDKNFWIGIIVVVAVFLVGYVYITKPKAKTAILTLLVLATLGLTVYSGYQIYFYNNTKNQMFGTYNSETINNQVIVKDLDFDFKNIEMLATGNGNEYAVKITTNDAFSLTADSYIVLVNNMPCDYIEISSAGDYVLATYQYNFYNDNKDLILNDTLTLRFALSPNSTTFTLTTQGGADAVALWNSYFNKNNFIVTLEESTASEAPDISYGEGEVTYVVANYYVADELILTRLYKPGDSVEFPALDSEVYGHWSVDGSTAVEEGYTINSSTDFHATYYTDEEFVKIALSKGVYLGILNLAPYPMTTIPQQAFSQMSNITTVYLPNTLKEIKACAFEYTGIKEIVIPEGVTKIENGAFASCSALTSITIPSTVTHIGSAVFYYCTSLQSITLPASLMHISEPLGNVTIIRVEGEIPNAEVIEVWETFYGCSDNLVINLGTSSIPATFVENWNSNGDVNLTVNLNLDPDTHPGGGDVTPPEDDEEIPGGS